MGLLDKLKDLFKQEEKKVVEEVDNEKDKIVEKELDAEQLIINKLYEDEGLTDDVLDMQVALNQKRNELDIPDRTQLNDEGWSQ